MTYSAATRASVRAAEKAAKLADANRKVVIVELMSSVPGRAWVYNLLAACHIYRNPFTTDTHLTAFACGEMNVGQQHILADIMRFCPDQYIQLLREANERSNTAAQLDRGSNGNGRDSGSSDSVDRDDYDIGYSADDEDRIAESAES